jgi:hypothetical protein
LNIRWNVRVAGPDAPRTRAHRRGLGALAAASAFLLVACGPGVRGEVIANTSSFAAGLTQDADFLYWRTEDALVRLSKQGGSPETIVTGQKPVANTVSGDRVFWLNRDDAGNVSLRSAATAGGDEQMLDSDESAGGGILRNLATDGMFLYWSNEIGEIRRAPVIGGDAVHFGSVPTRSASVAAVAGVVFATMPFLIARFEEGTDPTVLNERFDMPDHISLSSPPDDFFYWVERGNGGANGAVYRAARAGSQAARLAQREVTPDRPSSDGQNVYFVAGGNDKRIRRARVSGSSEAEDFSDAYGDPVVDATHVYWIDGEGAVHKAAK